MEISFLGSEIEQLRCSRQNARVEQGGIFFRVPDSSKRIPIEQASKKPEFWNEQIRIGNRYQLQNGLKEYMIYLAKDVLKKKWKKVYSFNIVVTGPGSNELTYFLGSILDDNVRPQKTIIHLNQEQVNFFMCYC